MDEELEEVLWRAWDVASGMGLGPERVPFRIRERRPLSAGQSDWPLLAASWWTHIGKGAVFGLGQLCIEKS